MWLCYRVADSVFGQNYRIIFLWDIFREWIESVFYISYPKYVIQHKDEQTHTKKYT